MAFTPVEVDLILIIFPIATRITLPLAVKVQVKHESNQAHVLVGEVEKAGDKE